MAAITLNILKPSVNNLTARIFVRAAELDFEEVDVWGKTTTPEFLAKDPGAPHADDRGGGPAARVALGELRDHAVPLQQARPRPVLSDGSGAERAMVDSAMFYLIGTLYPLLTRATYPALGFPQYPGEVGTSDADDAMKAQAQQDAEAALAEPLDVYRAFFLDGKQFIGGDRALDRRHPPRRVARVPARDRLRLPGLGQDYMAAMEAALGEAYSEPAADVRGYIEYVKSQSA